MYKRKDCLDTSMKPLIIKWLCKLANIENYIHSFKDQWITWSIWDNKLSISFDHRVKEQQELFDKLPKENKGCLQHGTGKLVNENVLYFTLSDIIKINYPNIVDYKLISKNLHQGGTNGWHSESDQFYTYDWEVILDDKSSILYHNQKNQMDMIKGDYTYNCRIQERSFEKYLSDNYGK